MSDDHQKHELMIIGAGPAGMTAAVYAARKRIKTVLLSKDVGGQVSQTLDIENYMGYQYITGVELTEKFEQQTFQFPIDKHLGIEVVRLYACEDGFCAETDDGKSYMALCVIIASGKRSRLLNVAGEERLRGRGVSYCSTCDAPLFAGLNVAVVGAGNSGIEASAELLKIAKHVYIVSRGDWNADRITVEKVEAAGNMTPLKGYAIVEILGDKAVSGLVIESRRDRSRKTLDVEGVFVEIGLIPNSEFCADLVKRNEFNEIIVDSSCGTNVPGVFAAGDVTDVLEKQIVVAAGEGAKAALSSFKYLLRKAA